MKKKTVTESIENMIGSYTSETENMFNYRINNNNNKHCTKNTKHVHVLDTSKSTASN